MTKTKHTAGVGIVLTPGQLRGDVWLVNKRRPSGGMMPEWVLIGGVDSDTQIGGLGIPMPLCKFTFSVNPNHQHGA